MTHLFAHISRQLTPMLRISAVTFALTGDLRLLVTAIRGAICVLALLLLLSPSARQVPPPCCPLHPTAVL